MATAAVLLAIGAIVLLVVLAFQVHAYSLRMREVSTSMDTRLGEVRNALQQGLADSGQLAATAQQGVSQSLQEATRLFSGLQEQLGSLQEAGRQLGQATRTLETVLSGARTRGSLGEAALEALLADVLPSSAYMLQYSFRTGSRVDAVVKLGQKLLPIDSKFPLEAYRRLAEATDPEATEQARKEFAAAVRKHADDIAAKYILPAEATLDLAFMFVASEGVYYELLLTTDAKGRLEEYCRAKRVVPVSPNSLHAYLVVILVGLRGMQVEENARRLLAALTGLQGQLNDFGELYTTLGTHLRNARDRYEEALPKLADTQRVLKEIAAGVLPPAT